MNITKTEPAVLIGLFATIVVLVAQQVLASGIVTSAGGIQWINLIISIVPLIAGVLTRQNVYSPASVAKIVDRASRTAAARPVARAEGSF